MTTTKQSLRIAIIGAGPAGFYAADHLLKQTELDIQVDMFDRLPTPFGLVRFGVAPDHPKIKNVAKVFDKTAANPKFRFFGNITCGKHLSPDDFRQHYHQIIYTVGAQTDRRLGIPGEDLAGSHSATEFVAWYNGHPDYRDLEFDLSQESVAIVGVGNVAVDVARILSRTVDELRETDIADHALEALEQSKVRRVTMLGRRGPAQAAFTFPELKELGKLEHAQCRALPEEAELDALSKQYLADNPDSTAEKKVAMLQQYAQAEDAGKARELTIRFLVSPTQLNEKDGRVDSVTLVKNELYLDDHGSLRPRATEQTETLNAGLVFRSVGYQGVAIEGVPFDDKRYVIPNEQGRVVGSTGEYCAGWIKRGPTGLIGTNKGDAIETVDTMLQDFAVGQTLSPNGSDIETLLQERQPDYVTYDHWRTLDAHEVALGEKHGRPRIKLTRVQEMLDALRE